MTEFEEHVTHLVTITVENDADIYRGWSERCDELIGAPGRLDRSLHESFEAGNITLREAVKSQLATELRMAFERSKQSDVADGTAVGGMMQDLLDNALARVHWETVAEAFMPPKEVTA